MAEGIIFGDYLLPKEEFIEIFQEFYAQKGVEFRAALQKEIIEPLQGMVDPHGRWSKSKNTWQAKNTALYNAEVIYKAWEKISTDYFGNSAVQLLAGTKFEGKNWQWTTLLNEADIVHKSGIAVTPKGLAQLQAELQDVTSIMVAQAVENIINEHYTDLLKSLDKYQLSTEDAHLFHQLVNARKSNLRFIAKTKIEKTIEHFTGETYNRLIYATQKNAEGKRLDAFMNHMGNYHNEIFSLMKGGSMNGLTLQGTSFSNTDDGFMNYFASKRQESQEWMLDSLNTASWLTGGDIVVVGKNGNVIYNIQLKTTMNKRGKNFDVASSSLTNFAQSMIAMIDADAKPVDLAIKMYDALKTTSSNNLETTESWIDEQAMEMVRKNLGLK